MVTDGKQSSTKTRSRASSKGSGASESLGDLIENRDELMSLGKDYIGKASRYIENEAKKNPYAILGAAVSLGYLFGQGWVRAVAKIGIAFVAQEAARRSIPNLSDFNQGKKIIH